MKIAPRTRTRARTRFRASPKSHLRPQTPFRLECSKLGALNRHYKHVASLYTFPPACGDSGRVLLSGFRNFTKSLTIFGPAVRAGLRNGSLPPSFLGPAAPPPAPVIRIEVSATPTAVGFPWSLALGKVNFLSVKREIDMAASCFIS